MSLTHVLSRGLFESMRNFISFLSNRLRRVVEPTSNDVVFTLSLKDLVIGFLSHAGDEWEFSYAKEFKEQEDVLPIVGFPDKSRSYRSKELWPFFGIRIPSLSQPSVQEFLREQNLESADDAALLKAFGRRSVSNPFELELQSS